MTDLTKTPVSIITGFLGSGKTTLLRYLMQEVQDKRLAIIVNEFGALGIDGEILRGCADKNCPADNIIELANGCICCTVADDFIPTIQAILQLSPPPDHILIETSGLALPKPLLQAFEWPEIRSKITVDGVIALADAEAVAAGQFASDIEAVDAQRRADDRLDHDSPLAELFQDQIACADIILMSKSDLVDEAGLERVKQLIQDHSPRPLPILPMREGVIDPRLILGLDAKAEADCAARPSHHDREGEGAFDHEHDDFESISLELGEYADVQTLTQQVTRLIETHPILRVKGYVAIKDKPMRLLVQAVGTRLRTQFDRAWGEGGRSSQLVVIGEHDRMDAGQVRAFFNAESLI